MVRLVAPMTQRRARPKEKGAALPGRPSNAQHGRTMPNSKKSKPSRSRKQRSLLSIFQLPTSKEAKKKLTALQRLGVYEPRWNPALKSNWTTARVREVERRFNQFQGDAKISINHRGFYPLHRTKRGWALTDKFRFRKGEIKANTDVRRFGITKTRKGAIVPKDIGRLYVDKKTGEVYTTKFHNLKKGQRPHGKKTYTLNVEETLRILHYISARNKRSKQHVEGKNLFDTVFAGIDEGNKIYVVDFFGTDFTIGDIDDLKRFANKYAAKLSMIPGKTIGAFTVEVSKA